MTEKEKILAVIHHLPEDTTIAKAIEELCVLDSVEAGLRDVEAGRLVSHEHVVNAMRQWGQRNGTTLVD